VVAPFKSFAFFLSLGYWVEKKLLIQYYSMPTFTSFTRWVVDTNIIIEPQITDFQEMAPNGSRGLVNVTHGQVTNMFLMFYQ
jgi:hypothetical protein